MLGKNNQVRTNERTDHNGNKYYLLVLNEDNTWEAIKQPFLIITDVECTITGQFISSIWYNEPIPDKDHHVAIVKINAANVAETMPTLLSDMNKIIQEERVETNPYIIMHHVFTKSKLDEIRRQLIKGNNETSTNYYRKTIGNSEFFISFVGRKVANILKTTSMYCPGFVLHI